MTIGIENDFHYFDIGVMNYTIHDFNDTNLTK